MSPTTQIDLDFYKKLLDEFYDGVYFVDRERRILYWNRGAERITGYASAEIVGRLCSDNLLMHVDREGRSLCTDGCPLRFTLTDGQSRSGEMYLHHKKGYRLPVSVRVTPIRNNSGEILGAVEVFTDISPQIALIDRVTQFERLAYIDPLTEVANRRYTEIVLAARREEMLRYGWPFGILFVDIDRFKDINDSLGHARGDEVLRMLARTLVNSVRSFDVVGRWGGDEFIAVIANVTLQEARMFADRIRILVEHSTLPGDPPVRITVSIGATVAREGDTVEQMVERADELMYKSKQDGRNRVTAAG